MKENSRDIPDKPLEQLPAVLPGDRVFRRLKKPRGRLRSILEDIRGRLRGRSSRHRGR